MKRILLISYYFPPSGGPGVQRLLKFARYLPSYGWLPTVLTVDPKYAAFPSMDESLLDEIPSQVEVIRTRAWDPFNLYAQIQGKKKEEIVKVGYIEGDQGIKRFSRWLRGNIFIPDARVGWIPFANSAAKKLVNKYKFDAMMSTGPPHSTHLIGLSVKKASEIPWVVDMRDPWVEIYYSDQMYETALARSIQTRIERKVLSTADTVISVSKHVGEGLKRRVSIQHYETIPNGYDPNDLPEKPPQNINRDKLVIAYVGTYNLLRHSNSFVYALRKLSDTIAVEVHLIGKVEPAAVEAYEFNGISVKEVGYLPHGEAVAYMQSVDILLLTLPAIYGRSGAGNVSGKVFEYISVQKPIIALGPVKGDLAKLLHETNAGEIFSHDDQEGIYLFLKRCSSFNNQPWNINEDALKEYERPRLTERLSHLLDRLTE